MSEPMDDFNEHLEKEWLVGRSSVIYQALHKRFRELGQKRTTRRVQELLEGSAHVPVSNVSGVFTPSEEMLMRATSATSQAMAETALIAVALYLAETESPTST
jgi:hypothetical protein